MEWKNGAKSAFALGFDLDGETIWINKTRALPNGNAYIKGPSIGQYGTKKGALRILEILDEFDLKTTWFIPANNVQKYPELVETILKHGHEIGHHGLDHTGEYGATFEEQRARIELCQSIFMKYVGKKAIGFRATGAVLPETERWMTADFCIPAAASAARLVITTVSQVCRPRRSIFPAATSRWMTMSKPYSILIRRSLWACRVSLPTKTPIVTGYTRLRALYATETPVRQPSTRRLRERRGVR